MFERAYNKLKWQQILKNISNEKMRRAVTELFIPFNIDITKFGINEDCFKKHNTYDFETQQTCTSSMVYWIENVDMYDYPQGFPGWFYPAFPDVAKWTQSDEGKEVLEPIFEEIGEALGDDDRRLRIFVLKRIVNEYIKHTHKKLETSL